MHPQNSPQTEARPRSAEERQRLLTERIGKNMRSGWRVETQSDYTVTMVKGKRPNHILHLLLTVLTLGLWAIVWIILAIFSHEHRIVITVDEYPQS